MRFDLETDKLDRNNDRNRSAVVHENFPSNQKKLGYNGREIINFKDNGNSKKLITSDYARQLSRENYFIFDQKRVRIWHPSFIMLNCY